MALVRTNTYTSTGPGGGGAVKKITLGLITPKGNIGGGEANGKSQCWALLEEFYSKRTVKGVP